MIKDGTCIPITLIHRRGALKKNRKNPLLAIVYGELLLLFAALIVLLCKYLTIFVFCIFVNWSTCIVNLQFLCLGIPAKSEFTALKIWQFLDTSLCNEFLCERQINSLTPLCIAIVAISAN